jgi:hypothetical protein
MDLVNFLELVEGKFLRARHASVADAALQVIRERKISFGELALIVTALSARMSRLGINASEVDPNLYMAKTLVTRIKQFVAVATEIYLTTKDEYIATIHGNRRGLAKQ